MHRGFVKAYLSVRDAIHQHITTQNDTSVVVTGHSLGGAIATLCALDLQYNFFDADAVKLYTFGCPRVGNADFRQSFSRRVPQSYRIINGMDIIPAMPRPWQGYRHIDREYRIGRRFSFRFISQRIRDHSISLYLEQLRQIASGT
ncbi:MAG: lipase family protein, partial [Cyanothece sp. SIO2G6]|nr:lipase family protein [Cyanothece sp. SIO2G6]